MKTFKFEEIIEINPKISLEKDKIYPFIEMANVAEYQRQPYKIDEKTYNSGGVKFEKYDTVVARIEPCLQNGKGFYVNDIEQGFGSTEFIVFRSKDTNTLNEKYLYYLMQQPYIRETMIKSMSGATGRQRVNNKIFEKIELNIPNINIQSRISNILSSYDDLIENNLKRIKLLEESAELIYKQWFVNLRFPGYEKCNMVDEVPESWNTKQVKEFGKVITGKTPPTKRSEYYDGHIPFIKTPDMNDVYIIKTNQLLTEEGAKSQVNKYVPKNTILVSCIGTVGVVSLTSELSQFNQQINGLVPNEDNYLYYMYFKFKSLKEQLEALGSSGATMLNVNKGKFESIQILEPSKEVLDNFMNICKPIFDNILNLQYQNEKLKEGRDILIPRLISGEIEV